MSPETDSTYGLHNVKKEIILSRRKTSFYATQVHCFMVMDCILIQEVKGLTKKLYFIILSRRKICNISLRFIVRIIYIVMGCIIIQRSKRVNEEILSRRKTSFYAGSLFTLFTWLWPAL